ncbi:helicase [Pyrodictium occultum]|uniref:Helicase n=1 Tax=Pyrodictium occultum TaxID=2309 RepID=A0A0V8RWJ8_PYROC|nr:DEAD/DEAH box helicase [Pyrodictium occultum]KSW12404.1 helicase [Pyrodictium occultum]
MAGSRVAAALRSLGYEILVWEEPGEEPEQAGKTFADVAPSLRGHEKAGLRLYRHQLEAVEALSSGMNVVLTARTGSGKTEAWALAALREGWRVLAVYPTLALAADQIRRLESYYAAAGLPGAVVRIDRPSLERRGRRGEELLRLLASARIVVTNPAFLLAEMKRLAVHPNRALLEDYLSHVDLLVFDELDFYGPRGAHLLLAIVELVSRHLASKPPRVVVLSATLGNPGELASLLTRITGRETRVIEGKPFKTPNRMIVVIGKGVEALRDYIRAYSSVIASRAPWILDMLHNEEEFREHLYEVYEALEAIGLRPPRPGLDPVEVLQAVLEASEPGTVTLVFTRSIRMAERLYRRLIERLPAEKQRLVGVHHHLVPKQRREALEEAARRGKIAMIITVRTLAQGIDIGSVKRVVHVGLPSDLREFMQREGRKGRRRELGVTETVVVPSGLWDRKLLEAGGSALKQWLSLPLEKLYINPSNAYARIFSAMWKLLRGLPVEPGEERLLCELGLVEEYQSLSGGRLTLSRKGWAFWNDLGFYEHGPPYGYRKVLVRAGKETVLRNEEVSHRDVVEKYQPGTYDPVSESIVVRVEPRELRIYEQPPEEAVEEHDWLARALARYEDLKRAWGERPEFNNDLRYGRIFTVAVLNVSAPTGGFGELVEEPVEVEWLVESRRPRLAGRAGGMVRVYHEVASLELNAPVAGRYRDYTYGYVFEAPGVISSEDLRLGLAALLVYLRLDPGYAIPLGLIRYRVVSVGPVKLIHLWEQEAAGLLESLDWMEVAEKVERFDYPGITVPLLAAIDPSSAVRVMRGEVPVERLRELAAHAARVVAGSRAVRAGGVVVEHPRPSKSHGIGAVAAVYETLEADGKTVSVAAVASYDGERMEVDSYRGGIGLDSSAQLARMALKHLDRLLSQGLRVAYYGQEQRNMFIRLLAGSYTGVMALRAAEQEGRLVDAAERASRLAGDTPLLTLVEPRVRSYLEWANKAKARRDPEELENALRSLASAMTAAAYRILLAAEKGRIRVETGSRSEASAGAGDRRDTRR